jgi:putative ABC transport system permease protein
MEFLWHDWRFAARSLRKSPGFTSVAVLTLALGIGASCAIFSVVYGVLLRPFPYRAPDALVLISAEQTFGGQVRSANYSSTELDGWQTRAHAFDSIAMWGSTSYRVRTATDTQTADASYVSAGFFATLDQPMLRGRPIGEVDARLPVAIISERFWRRQFGARPDVLGQPIVLNEHPYAVIGIARDDFQFPSAAIDVWTPLAYAQTLGEEPWINNRRGGGFHFVARLRSGTSLAVAQRDAEEVARSLAAEFPETDSRGRRPVVFGLTTWFTDKARPALLMLFAAVGLVLIVACANAMNLLLARQASRSHEISIRRALGASPARLVSYAIAESSLLAAAGGVAGVFVAALSVRSFVSLWPSSLPRAEAIHADRPVLLFALLLSASTALACAIGPALRCLGYSLGAGLRPTGATQSRGTRRAWSILVIAQVTASIILLVGSGLLGRSLVRLLHADLGVVTDHVIVGEMSLGQTMAPGRQIEAVDRVLARVSAVPGVRRASVTTSSPLNGARLRYTLKGVATAGGAPRDYDVEALATTPAFFPTLGVPLVRGRLFSDADTASSQPVMIMSARTAQRFFGERDPIGNVLSLPVLGRKGPVNVTLVGVVGNIKYNALDAPADGGIYRPFAQQPVPFAYLIVQASEQDTAIAGAIRRSVAEVDGQIAFDHIRTLDETLSRSAAEPRFRTVLLVSLAALASTLAVIGLYGAVAYSVSMRTTELGIRMALGASAADVTRMVVSEGVTLACVGAAIGVAAAFALAHAVRSLLFGVGPTDAVSFVGAPIGLLVVAGIASYLPARRAAAINPIAALRAE